MVATDPPFESSLVAVARLYRELMAHKSHVQSLEDAYAHSGEWKADGFVSAEAAIEHHRRNADKAQAE